MILFDMEEEDEIETCFPRLKFPYLPLPAATMLSPVHPSGMATPPLQTLASVPFKWEELPGKPRPCTDILVQPEPAKFLELPPSRMLFMEPASTITRIHSPSTVIDGPFINVGRPKFSSFRWFRDVQGSFDSSSSGGGSPLSSVDLLLGKKKASKFFGRSFSVKRSKKEIDWGSFGFSPSSAAARDSGTMKGKMTRNRSSSGLSQATSNHLWVTMYESLKKAIPWKRTGKSKKEGASLKNYCSM